MANNSYDIFQLKNDDSTRELRFEGLRRLAKMGAKVQRENYDLIYNAPLGDKDTLNSIYEKFNLYHPEDFRGHSLSVSDIVVFHKDGVDTAYYVDSFGFAEVPEFLLVKAMEKAISMESEQIAVAQHIGTWHPIEKQEIDGRLYFLLEHDTYGDEVASVIVDEKGILYAQEVYDGFSQDIVDLIRLEAAPLEVVPDPSVSAQDMEKYGYSFLGMVPMSAETAEQYYKQGSMMMYALHPDGTESVIGSEKQFQRHVELGGLFGVEKQDWMKYLENGEYLRAAEVSEEQNYNMIDGRNNNRVAKKEEKNTDEKPSLLGRLKEKQEQLSSGAKKDAPAQSKKSERDMQ